MSDSFDWGEPAPGMTLRDAFERYHAENPHIYRALCKYAQQAIEAGRSRLGIAMLFERLRWYSMIEARNDAFKLNNNYRAFYARLWLADHPEHPDLFSTREQRYAGVEESVS